MYDAGKDAGPHADRKFQNTDPEELCCKKMPQFMKKDQKRQRKNSQYNAQKNLLYYTNPK